MNLLEKIYHIKIILRKMMKIIKMIFYQLLINNIKFIMMNFYKSKINIKKKAKKMAELVFLEMFLKKLKESILNNG